MGTTLTYAMPIIPCKVLRKYPGDEAVELAVRNSIVWLVVMIGMRRGERPITLANMLTMRA